MPVLLEYWSWDPLAIFSITLFCLFYLNGIRDLSPNKIIVISGWRKSSFFSGMGITLFVLIGPIDYLATQLFFYHMIQHLLLTHLAAPLILLGIPVFPILRGLPKGVRYYTVSKLSKSKNVKLLLSFLSHPASTWVFFVTTFWAWHIPGLYSAAVENELIHLIEHMMFIVSALMFWWSIVTPSPFHSKVPYLARGFYIILALTQGLPLSAFITFASEPLYSVYLAEQTIMDINPLVDQQIGGLIMWIGTMVPYFISLGLIFWLSVVGDKKIIVENRYYGQ